MAHDHHAHFSDLGSHGTLMRRATYAAVAVASLLLVVKLLAWWETGSLAMLSSFTDSVFDLVMSCINLAAVRYALKPADEDHRFGHSSIEDIAGLAQFAFIVATMALIMLQSVKRLTGSPPLLENPSLGMAVSAAGLVITAALVAFQTYVTRRTKSLVVMSDRLHYAGDILFNLGVFAAFGLSAWFGLAQADAIIAIVIAVVVLWSNRTIGVRAFNNLMNREMPAAEKATIEAIVQSVKEIHGYHNLKTRYAGAKAFIQLHIEISAAMNFRDAHAITDRLENALMAAFPHAEVIVHADPVEMPHETAVH